MKINHNLLFHKKVSSFLNSIFEKNLICVSQLIAAYLWIYARTENIKLYSGFFLTIRQPHAL